MHQQSEVRTAQRDEEDDDEKIHLDAVAAYYGDKVSIYQQ